MKLLIKRVCTLLLVLLACQTSVSAANATVYFLFDFQVLSRSVDAGLAQAVEQGKMKEIERALDARARIEQVADMYLMQAISQQNAEAVKQGKRWIAERLDRLNSTLFTAVSKNNIPAVKLLLAQGADINVHFPAGSLLAIASAQGYTEMFEFLLRSGASMKDGSGGGTFLRVAALYDQAAMVQLLLDKGVNPNQIDPQTSQSVMMDALMFGRENAIYVLLEHGARVDVKNQVGQTPLHLAASRAPLGVVRALLRKGADATLRDKSQNTALDYAKLRTESSDKAQIIELLDKAAQQK